MSPERDLEKLRKIAKASLEIPFIRNEPFEVTEDMLLDAILMAHGFGSEIAESAGDSA